MNAPIFQPTKDFQFSFIENSKHWNMYYHHYHDGYEIYFQTAGTREIFFAHQSYLLRPGTVCIITPHILHSTKNAGEDQCYSRHLLNFKTEIFREFLTESEINAFFNEFSSCIFQLDAEQCAVLSGYLENIHTYWDMRWSGIPRGTKLAYMEAYRIMDYLLRLIQNSDNISTLSDVPVISDSEIYKVIQYIEEHYAENIELRDMLSLAHMSRPTFYRAFKQITGDSFGHYLNRFRAVKAHALILQSSLPLTEIALKTGFPSTAHMTRIFREIHGVSPSEFRRGLK